MAPPKRRRVLPDPKGTLLDVFVTAQSSQEGFPLGWDEWRGAFLAHVRNPPKGGEANRALLALVSQALGVGRGDVEIVHGHRSRSKRILVRGKDPEDVEEILRGGKG